MKNLTQHSLRKVVWLVGLCTSLLASAQQIDRAEYFWDQDPGYDQATALPVIPGAAVNIDTGLTTPTIPGTHMLGLRYHSSGGWSPTYIQYVAVPIAAETYVSHAEYFWDDDPGYGQATALNLTPDQDVSIVELIAVPDELPCGTHQLGLRYLGTNGWSPTVVFEVYKPSDASVDIAHAEYFWDVDPGFGQGTALNLTADQDVNIEDLITVPDELPCGTHQLGMRYLGTNGWSPTVVYEIYKPSDASVDIAHAEYFWNEDPGFGQGTPISLTPGQEVSLDDFSIPTFIVHGDAMLFIRYRGTNGWSGTMAFPVMVDAEGNYTLNAQAETSMEQRNYQSLADMMDDFADRGIGGSITLTLPTKQTDYALDVTDAARLAQIVGAAQDLEECSTPDNPLTLTFKAAAGSGNSVSLTANDADLPAIVSLLARTRLENVALNVNGTAYDFTSATYRRDEQCAEGETVPVSLSAISSNVRATWQAQPHASTMLSGFTESGEGDLPSMSIQNNGTQADSIDYAVTLNDANGRLLYTYIYNIKVHARVSRQSFAGLTPASGSSLDPVVTRLAWNAVGDAVGGYSLVVTEAAEGAEPAEIVNVRIDSLHYDVNVKSGYAYTWTVTAHGYCDELTSPVQTFTGRLLPDLVVTAFTLPEAAEAGNMLSVTATVKNQGTGASTEAAWTDRLYYVVDSQDFAQAVEAANVAHTGNIEPDGTYDVTFTMKVPYVETGTLRVFVVADANGNVMETDETNNRQLSSTGATLSPFYINEGDLAILRQLYSDFGGDSWNGTKWNTSSELVANGNWSGITFDTEGYVTSINLQKRALTGSLSVTTPYIASLSRLTSLNLSRNTLTGDPALYLSGIGSQLTSVDLSYNQIDELSSVLASTITTLNLGYQYRKDGNVRSFPGFDEEQPVMLNVGTNMTPLMPTLLSYNHAEQNFSTHPEITIYKHSTSGLNTVYGYLRWSATNDCYVFSLYATVNAAQDELVHMRIKSGAMAESSYPATIHFIRGDANSTGFVDVTDVQSTLNYILTSSSSGGICLWAANTWTDDETEGLINIQDIVCTVNLVLDNQGEGSPSYSRRRAPALDQSPANLFYASGRYVELKAQDEIAAFCLELQGVKSDQIRLLLNLNDWQMQTRDTDDGVRLLVFSPTGKTLPAGQSRLLRMSSSGEPVGVQASNVAAQAVEADVLNDGATDIEELSSEGTPTDTYDLQGRKMNDGKLHKGIYIKKGRKEVRK